MGLDVAMRVSPVCVHECMCVCMRVHVCTQHMCGIVPPLPFRNSLGTGMTMGNHKLQYLLFILTSMASPAPLEPGPRRFC